MLTKRLKVTNISPLIICNVLTEHYVNRAIESFCSFVSLKIMDLRFFLFDVYTNTSPLLMYLKHFNTDQLG